VAMDNYTRMFAARNEQVAKRGTLLATVFLLPIAVGTVWIGMTAVLTHPGIENGDSVLSTFVMDAFPVGLKGLMLVGILAALMSTADICILTAAANGSRDIYQRYVNPEVSPKKMFRISVWLAAIVGLLAALMAWQMQDVIGILIIAFTINSAALVVPTFAIVAQNKVNADAAFWSITLSLITVIGWYIGSTLELASIFTIDPLWPGLLVSIIVFAGISLFAGVRE